MSEWTEWESVPTAAEWAVPEWRSMPLSVSFSGGHGAHPLMRRAVMPAGGTKPTFCCCR
jgi:hypothetical protein